MSKIVFVVWLVCSHSFKDVKLMNNMYQWVQSKEEKDLVAHDLIPPNPYTAIALIHQAQLKL